jgi:hypothetical protein
MTKVRAQTDDAIARTEAATEKPVLMELLQPLGVIHVRLSTWEVVNVARVH